VQAFLPFVLAAGLGGQPPEVPPFVRANVQGMMTYYQAPDPARGPQLLKELLKRENIDSPWFAGKDHVRDLLAAQLGDIAAGHPRVVREYEAGLADASAAGRRVVLRALRNAGDAETARQAARWLADPRFADLRPELEALQKHLDDPNRKHARDRAAQTPDDLDFLWVNFFTTGAYAPVARILDVFDLPDAPANAVLKRVARWSLGANLQQHPRLGELVRQHAKDRAAGSRKVIEELIPVVDPKAGEAVKAAVVGKWVSDDDQKNPLEFLPDGTAKVGFIVEKGAWLIATGTYTVSDQGTVEAKTTHEGSTLFQSWTLKDGVLLGSRGPNPMVRWVKVGGEKK
jgi:hypothetical protein